MLEQLRELLWAFAEDGTGQAGTGFKGVAEFNAVLEKLERALQVGALLFQVGRELAL